MTRNFFQSPARLSSTSRAALKIVAAYLIFGSIWIYLSQNILLRLFPESHQIARLQTWAGWLFITTTALLLFGLLCRHLRRVHRSGKESKAEGEVDGIPAAAGDISERERTQPALSWEAEANAAFAELATALLTGTTDISTRVLEHAKRLTRSRFGYVGYIDPQSGHLVTETLTKEIWEDRQGANKTVVFEKFTGLWGWVLTHRQPLMTNHPQDDPRSSGTPPGHMPIERFLSVPAMLGETLVGQVTLANPGRDYDQRDLDLAQRLASLYAIAIQRQRAEETLRQSERFARAAIDALPQHIAILDEQGSILTVNKAWLEFARENGGDPARIGQGSNYLAVCGTGDSQEAIAFGEAIRAVMRGELSEFSLEYPCDSPSKARWFIGRVARFPGDGPIRIVITHENITELKQAERAIEHLAYHDSLTGLPNRTLLLDRLDTALARAKRDRRMLGVMFLDLDHFKEINDTFGHAMGDRLLREVAERVSPLVRRSDTFARFAGDEFVFVLTALRYDHDAAVVAHKIYRALEAPFHLAGHQVHVSTSIGIAIHPYDGSDTSSLLRNADTAMYQAKEGGRNTFRFFSPEMNRKTQEFEALEAELKLALERRELELHFQPQFDLTSGRLAGAEALLLWRHPKQGEIPTAKFIPVAEKSGLIEEIGGWALHAACSQAVDWERHGLVLPWIAINLSPRQLHQPDLAETVARLLEETGLPPQRLELEFTEPALMVDTERVGQILKTLKEIGVRLALDNFGAGFSSLSLLDRLPIDRFKIDHAFIRGIAGQKGATLAKAIIAVTRHLDRKVVAKGVENEEQVAFLRENGCDEAQGFYFSRPVPAAEFDKLAKHLSGGDLAGHWSAP